MPAAIRFAVIAAVALAATSTAAADRIRIAVQRTGTLSWELDVIRTHGLDRKAALTIEPIELASTEAGKIALKGGSADLMLSDWLWVARERTLGDKLVFYPSSSTLGAVMVPMQSPINDIADLKGRKLAIAGGPLDKSWLLLQALARRSGLDLRRQATIVYGAPPLLSEKARQGEHDATLTFWNFCADLEGKGFRRAVEMSGVMKALGAKGPVAIVGYTFDADWAERHRAAVDRFLRISREAKQILAASEAEWQRLAPRIGTSDAKALAIYRQRYSEGIVRRPLSEEEDDAGALYRVLAEIAGAELVGPARRAGAGHVLPAGCSAMNLTLRLLSLALLIAAWVAGSQLAGARLLPDPQTVALAIVDEARSGALAFNLGATLARVAVAFFIAMLLGAAIGLVMGRFRVADRLADPWLIVLLNLPALVIIVLAYVWAGLTETAAILAVALNKLPIATVTVREGARSLDRGLDDMAQVFRIGPWTRLRHVVIPQLAPYLAAAARSGLSLVWKIVLIVELLGRPNGVGFEIGVAFQLFDVTRILAYALAFIAVMLAIETFLVQPLERHVARWRPRPA